MWKLRRFVMLKYYHSTTYSFHEWFWLMVYEIVKPSDTLRDITINVLSIKDVRRW